MKQKMMTGNKAKSEIDEEITKHDEVLKKLDKLEFNVLDFSRQAKRENVLSIMTIKALKNMDCLGLVDEPKLLKFLGKATSTYQQSVEYHNDLHGADVVQHGYYIMTTCQMD